MPLVSSRAVSSWTCSACAPDGRGTSRCGRRCRPPTVRRCCVTRASTACRSALPTGRSVCSWATGPRGCSVANGRTYWSWPGWRSVLRGRPHRTAARAVAGDPRPRREPGLAARLLLAGRARACTAPARRPPAGHARCWRSRAEVGGVLVTVGMDRWPFDRAGRGRWARRRRGPPARRAPCRPSPTRRGWPPPPRDRRRRRGAPAVAGPGICGRVARGNRRQAAHGPELADRL
jgi:hypothetical protein